MKWLVAAAIALLLALPLWLNSYAVTVFIFIFFYAFLGQAWNIVGGYAGQLSAGHAAFVGIGAYASALLSAQAGLTPWIGMLVGGVLAAVLGTVVGYLGGNHIHAAAGQLIRYRIIRRGLVHAAPPTCEFPGRRIRSGVEAQSG